MGGAVLLPISICSDDDSAAMIMVHVMVIGLDFPPCHTNLHVLQVLSC